jgi:hypothetical protein
MNINKDINLVEKYPRLKLDKYIISNLRFLKNEKHLYLKKPFTDIFTDTSPDNFFNTIQNYKNDARQLFFETLFNNKFYNVNSICLENNKTLEISVSLYDYLNSIILKSYFNQLPETLKNLNTSFNQCFFQYQTSYFQSYLVAKSLHSISLFDCLCISDYKLTKGIFGFNQKFYLSFLVQHQHNLDLLHTIFKDVENLLDDLKFNTLSNCNVAKCCLTGFYFHKNNLLSFYDTENKFNAIEKFKNDSEYNLKRFYKVDKKNYIYKYFVSNITNQLVPYSSDNFIRLDLSNVLDNLKPVPEIKFIKFLNTAIFVDDSYFKTTNYLTKFKSNNNKLRSCYDDVLKVLDKLYFKDEDKKKTQLYGIEIETFSIPDKAPDTIIKDIEENYLKGRAICKSDGSIGDNGIEIVSTAMSFNYIKNSNLFYNFHNQVKDFLGSYSRSSTGVHIHISRDTLTKLQILRIISFINNEMNFNYLARVAGREFFNNQYCETLHKNYDLLKLNHYFANYPNLIYPAKYSAVNLSKKSTVELRIFKGNIRFDVLNRYVEFTDCLINFVKNSPVSFNDYMSFLKFVDLNKNNYPYLYAFNQIEIVKNGIKEFKGLSTGYKFTKLLDKRKITYKPLRFELLENIKLPKVRKPRQAKS